MKKTLVFLILFTFSMNYSFPNVAATFPDFCDDPIITDLDLYYSLCFDYTTPEDPIPDYSQYREFYKDEGGIWHGLIEITDYDFDDLGVAYNEVYGTVIYIKLSRELNMLYSVKYDYITAPECIGLDFFGVCIGFETDSQEGTETVYDSIDDGLFSVWFPLTDNIKEFSGSEYDYIISSNISYRIIEISNLLFDMVLTDAEVIDANLDIQLQYEEERSLIEDNPLLSIEEKAQLLDDLISDYSEYSIEFGERIIVSPGCDTIPCVLTDDEYDQEENEVPWLQVIIDEIVDVAIKIGIVLASVITTATVVILIVRATAESALRGTGNIAKNSLKFASTSGNFWGKAIANGIAAFFSNTINGSKSIFLNILNGIKSIF